MQNWVAGKIKINTALAFLFGIVFLLIALCVSLVCPQSDRAMTKVILRIIVALSAASIAAGIPGLFALSFLSPGKMLTVRITGALLIFLIVCGIDAQPSEAAVFIEMTLILLTPALIQQGLRRQLKMKVTPSTLFLLSAAFILCEAAFFSQLTGGRVPEFPPVPPDVTSERDIFKGKDLLRTNQQHLWVLQNSRVYVGKGENSDATTLHELHLLLTVEWQRWEKFPQFPRNYKGQIYYRIVYQCQGDEFAHSMTVLVGSSLKPGRIVLSWLIGFVEIPFLLDDIVVREKIERMVRKELSLCSL
jgi:hypothetical protein